MSDFLAICKKVCLYAMLFSMFINILQLTFSLYMLQVYDRVLTSYNTSTLAVITLAAVVALAALAILEWIRSRLLIRIGVEFERKLAFPILDTALRMASALHKQPEQGDIRDVQVLRGVPWQQSCFCFFRSSVDAYLFFVDLCSVSRNGHRGRYGRCARSAVWRADTVDCGPQATGSQRCQPARHPAAGQRHAQRSSHTGNGHDFRRWRTLAYTQCKGHAPANQRQQARGTAALCQQIPAYRSPGGHLRAEGLSGNYQPEFRWHHDCFLHHHGARACAA